MPCNSCGKENLPGAKYCVYCGASPTKLCRSCGKGNEEGAKYCVYCGASSETIAAATVVKAAAPIANPTKPCSSCGKKNEEEAKYCVYCGAETNPNKVSWWGKFKSAFSL